MELAMVEEVHPSGKPDKIVSAFVDCAADTIEELCMLVPETISGMSHILIKSCRANHILRKEFINTVWDALKPHCGILPLGMRWLLGLTPQFEDLKSFFVDLYWTPDFTALERENINTVADIRDVTVMNDLIRENNTNVPVGVFMALSRASGRELLSPACLLKEVLTLPLNLRRLFIRCWMRRIRMPVEAWTDYVRLFKEHISCIVRSDDRSKSVRRIEKEYSPSYAVPFVLRAKLRQGPKSWSLFDSCQPLYDAVGSCGWELDIHTAFHKGTIPELRLMGTYESPRLDINMEIMKCLTSKNVVLSANLIGSASAALKSNLYLPSD